MGNSFSSDLFRSCLSQLEYISTNSSLLYSQPPLFLTWFYFLLKLTSFSGNSTITSDLYNYFIGLEENQHHNELFNSSLQTPKNYTFLINCLLQSLSKSKNWNKR